MRQLLEEACPGATRPADDLVLGALLPDVVVRRDGREDGDADLLREGARLAGVVVLVDDDAGDADVATELAEVLRRRADVVGDVERLQVVRADDDDFLAHVAGDRQTEAAADDVAEEVEENVVEAPVVEAELLQGLEAVDDPSPAAAAAHLRSAELHGEDAVALEADIADGHLLAGVLLARRGVDDGRAGAAAEEERGGVALGVATDEEDLLALLGHHVTEIGQGEALADSALAVDGNDLRLFLGSRGRGHIRFESRLGAQTIGHLGKGLGYERRHGHDLQSSSIFRTGRIGERGGVGLRRLGKRSTVRQQTVEGHRAGGHQGEDRVEVGRLPLGGDAQPRFLHEGERESEVDGRRVKAGEDDLAAAGEAADEGLDQARVAADVVDGVVVAARVVVGIDDEVALGTLRARRALLPDDRRAAGGDGETREQAPEDAVTDDEVRGTAVATDERVLRGGGERQEHAALAERIVDLGDARRGHHQTRGGAAEETAHLAKAVSARNEDAVARAHGGRRVGFTDATDRFVAGNQRIAEPGKGRHFPAVEKPLGARADGAPLDVHKHLAGAERRQREAAELDVTGLLEDDSNGAHGVLL